MVDPISAWRRLRTGSQRPLMSVRGRQETRPEGHPVATVFRCADTDIASEMVFGQLGGSLIDVSTWGHVLDTGVLGTLEYSVENLQAPLIVVLGHHGCAAMDAAVRAWRNAEFPHGASRLAIEQALSSIVRRGSISDSAGELASAHVVLVGMSLLERSPAIARRVDAGRCGIVCATIDDAGMVRPHAIFGPRGPE